MLCGGIAGSELKLEFDGSAGYSFIGRDSMQACFFAYDAAEEYYIELYLILPAELSAGTTLTPETAYAAGARECGVTLYEVDGDEESDCYYASALMGMPMPARSSFSIDIGSVFREADALTVSGTLNAVLGSSASDAPNADAVGIRDADFSFTLAIGNAEPADGTEEELPSPTDGTEAFGGQDPFPSEGEEMPDAQDPFSSGESGSNDPFGFSRSSEPAPAFTLPPDYRKI